MNHITREAAIHIANNVGFTGSNGEYYQAICNAAIEWHIAQQPKNTCIGKDPLCPCQDGDQCHYKGKDAWPVRVQPPAPDCRTCSHRYIFNGRDSCLPQCTNGDQYQPSQPVVLWRTK